MKKPQIMLKFLSLLFFLLIFTNCNIEDVTLDSSENNKEIETVSINEALGLFQEGSTMRSTFSKSKSIYNNIELDFDRIKQEAITNSEELLTIIPVNTPYKEVNSRILLLKINGELKSVAFNMIRTKKEEDKKFTGDIIITDLEANFLHGYKVNKGIIMSMLIKSASSKASKDVSLKSLRLMNKADPEDGESDCIYSDPSWCDLDEVVIYGSSGGGNNYIPVGGSGGVYFVSGSATGDTSGGVLGGTSGDSTEYSWDYGTNEAEKRIWYLDFDGDGYHSLTKLAITPTAPGQRINFWKSSTKGFDCDDGNPSLTTDCSCKTKCLLVNANENNDSTSGKTALAKGTTTSEDIDVSDCECELPPPPSCKSFNFKDLNPNWQEASVIGIRFNIVVIEIVSGIRIKKVIPISFLQPVKFGMPKSFRNGSQISSGLAAEISARAIAESIDDVISRYNNLANSSDVIRSHFQERLKHNFRESSNGGRVNFNDISLNNVPSVYKTSAFFTDDCD